MHSKDVTSGGRFHSVISVQALQASSNIGYIAHGAHHYKIHDRILASFFLLFSICTSLYFWSCCRGFVSRDRGETEASGSETEARPRRSNSWPRRDRGEASHSLEAASRPRLYTFLHLGPTQTSLLALGLFPL